VARHGIDPPQASNKFLPYKRWKKQGIQINKIKNKPAFSYNITKTYAIIHTKALLSSEEAVSEQGSNLI